MGLSILKINRINKKIDLKSLVELINKGLSISDIKKEMNVSSHSVYSNIKFFKPDILFKLKKNNLNKLNSKGGQMAIYKKLRNEIKEGKHRCEQCGSLKHIEIHHKISIHYDSNYRYWKADNFNNNIDNIIFLCNSCHQILHYNKYGRKPNEKRDLKTGRYISC